MERPQDERMFERVYNSTLIWHRRRRSRGPALGGIPNAPVLHRCTPQCGGACAPGVALRHCGPNRKRLGAVVGLDCSDQRTRTALATTARRPELRSGSHRAVGETHARRLCWRTRDVHCRRHRHGTVRHSRIGRSIRECRRPDRHGGIGACPVTAAHSTMRLCCLSPLRAPRTEESQGTLKPRQGSPTEGCSSSTKGRNRSALLGRCVGV